MREICERAVNAQSDKPKEEQKLSETQMRWNILHWYDFLCPFCYIAQSRNDLLRSRGAVVEELAFQAHPEIPAEGKLVGPRSGPMYVHLANEAKTAGLELNWPDRLPNTRLALAIAEWTRRNQQFSFHTLQSSLFRAHFVYGEDIGSLRILERYASAAEVDMEQLDLALSGGTAMQDLDNAEAAGRRFGVSGTPAWLIGGKLISGLLPDADFERLVALQQAQ